MMLQEMAIAALAGSVAGLMTRDVEKSVRRPLVAGARVAASAAAARNLPVKAATVVAVADLATVCAVEAWAASTGSDPVVV